MELLYKILLITIISARIFSDVKDSTDDKNNSMNMMDMGNKTPVLWKTDMSMEGFGTSWKPVAEPMHMHMYSAGEWMLMLHGNISIRYDHQGSLRGDNKFDAPDWLMFSARRMIASDNELLLRAMVSIDRITEGGNGYPLLFQTGETWNGIPLMNKQHPHDLFSEISVTFTHRLSDNTGIYLYAGYPGEPALGPPVFMHRASASSDPDAPISHHWQDATHITFGVITGGVKYKNIKIESSVFNGREPDENRFNFDKLRLDSYSGRVSFNPTDELALQLSYGYLKNPEGNGINVKRTTASVLFSKNFNDKYLTAAAVWGENNDSYAGHQESALLESQFTFSGNAFYTRLELVQKPQSELGVFIEPTRKELVGEYTFGFKRNITKLSGLDFNLGTQFTIYTVPSDLKTFYGNSPFSYEFYISVHPSIMSTHSHMHHMKM